MSSRATQPQVKVSISKMRASCDNTVMILRALAHPDRLMIMGHLTHGPKTVSELQEACGTSQSQLSQFLGRMRLEGLLLSERHGKFISYRIADQKILDLIMAIERIFCPK